MRCYYNEWDKNAAAWLRELIRMGLIPDGEVDERSILDVDPVDLWGFDQWHFFAGIAGWPLALQMAGLGDVEGIMTGSPPCQPFSSAGKQKGREDERHLAPKFIELVTDVRPRLLFGEQVASAQVFGKTAGGSGKRSAGSVAEGDWCWIDDLSGRLEAAHYAVGATDLPAASVGAPHLRQRTFFGAVDLVERLDDATGARSISSGVGAEVEARDETRLRGSERGCSGGGVADALDGQQWGRGGSGGQNSSGAQSGSEPGGRGEAGRMADAEAIGRGEERPVRGRVGQGDREEGRTAGHDAGGDAGRMVDSQHDDRRADFSGREPEGGAASGRGGASIGLADSLEPGLERHAGDGDRGDEPGRVEEDAAGSTAEGGGSGGWTGTADCPWHVVDWLFCRDGKWRPVESSLLSVADGLPGGVVRSGSVCSASYPLTTEKEARVMRLKGYGNAIVPQVGAVFIEAFMDALWLTR